MTEKLTEIWQLTPKPLVFLSDIAQSAHMGLSILQDR